MALARPTGVFIRRGCVQIVVYSRVMANPYAPPSTHESSDVGDERFDYKSTQALSLAVRALLVVCMVVAAVSIVHSFAQLDLFDRIANDGAFTLAEAQASDQRALLIMALYLLVFLASAIAWIVWQTRTSKNARALGTDFMQFGPNAWGWFFCPFINLVRPLAVVRELWQVNDPTASSEAPGYFTMWWLPWVIGNILGNISARIVSEDSDIDELILGTQLDVASDVLLIVSGIFAIKVVTEIHRREQRRALAGSRVGS